MSTRTDRLLRRREAVIETACGVFFALELSRDDDQGHRSEAGVTEPILYRHFASKRDLYLACLDAAWTRVQALLGEALDEEPEPTAWLQRSASPT